MQPLQRHRYATGDDDDEEDDADDEVETRRMIAVHLASTNGREPSEAELGAEYEALIADLNGSRS